MNRAPIMALTAAWLLGCGPTKLAISPDAVTKTTVRPASGQHLFCPGDPFLVEVVTAMTDGSRCSTHDDKTGCMGQEGILDPALVEISADSGRPKGEGLVWIPDPDPLKTAGTGMLLQARIGHRDGDSTVASTLLKPVYECKMGGSFDAPPQNRSNGAPGMAGPNLHIAVTPLSTPFYPDAALVRVRAGSRTEYFISASHDQPLRITTRGQDGARGRGGASGTDGVDGADGSLSSCQPGTAGGDGGDGQPGGPGGNAGPAGTVVIALDQAHADRLRSRVIIEVLPGSPGAGGNGGQGGRAGDGGRGSGGKDCPHNNEEAPDGRAGQRGTPGPAGNPAPPAEPPIVELQPRDVLFGVEKSAIAKIEAMPAQ